MIYYVNSINSRITVTKTAVNMESCESRSLLHVRKNSMELMNNFTLPAVVPGNHFYNLSPTFEYDEHHNYILYHFKPWAMLSITECG